MKNRVLKKYIAAGMAMLCTIGGVQAHVSVAEKIESETTSEFEVMSETQLATESKSNVTVVHTAETDEVHVPVDWWKASINEYADNFSLIHYQSVDDSTRIGAAKTIAEGRDDSITASMPAESAVYNIDAGQFAFTSYGWGHCVGMSQNGANFYAKYAGWNYQDILFHYYPGTTLVNTGSAETELVTVNHVPGNVLQQVSEIVNREIGPSFHEETIKAQAVAIYTYIKYHNDDAHDLLGKPDPPQNLVDACASVLGEALVYDEDFALTMFGASSGGITANCSDVFSTDLPYLRSVISEYDAQYDPYWGEVKYFTIDEMRNILQNAYGITLSPDPQNWITLIEGNGGYINSVIVDGQITVRGYAFSNMLGLRAPKYTYVCSLPSEEESETSYFDDIPDILYSDDAVSDSTDEEETDVQTDLYSDEYSDDSDIAS